MYDFVGFPHALPLSIQNSPKIALFPARPPHNLFRNFPTLWQRSDTLPTEHALMFSTCAAVMVSVVSVRAECNPQIIVFSYSSYLCVPVPMPRGLCSFFPSDKRMMRVVPEWVSMQFVLYVTISFNNLLLSPTANKPHWHWQSLYERGKNSLEDNTLSWHWLEHLFNLSFLNL